jgi:histidinol-phosphate aminotransferase
VAAEVLATLPARTVAAYPFHGPLVERLAELAGLPSDQVMITAGSDDAVKIIAEALFGTTGRLVLQEPNYELVRQYARLRRVDVLGVPPGPDRRFRLDDLRPVLTRAAPASVYVANPNGPLGTRFTLEEMATLAGWCSDTGNLLFVDEAYVAYHGFDHVSMLRGHEHVVLVRSLSKSHGIPGARLGILLAHPAVIEYLRPWQSANPVTGMTAPIMTGFLAHAGELSAARQEIIETRDWFARAVTAAVPSWRALPAHGNFVNIVVEDPDALAESLLAHGIRVKSMDRTTAMAGCLKITITDRVRMERVLETLVAAHRALRPRTSTRVDRAGAAG